MKYYSLLRTEDGRGYFIDNLAQGSPNWTLSSGMTYLEKGIEKEISLLDEDNILRLRVKLPDAFTQIKTSALELNTEIEIVEILKDVE